MHFFLGLLAGALVASAMLGLCRFMAGASMFGDCGTCSGTRFVKTGRRMAGDA